MNILTVIVLTFPSILGIESYSPTSLQKEMAVEAVVNEQHKLVLYYTSYCPYSQKVLNYLKKINKTLPMKNLENDPQAKAELKEIGGKMQVPCLLIDGRALYDSGAIIEWLSQHQNELEST